MGVNIWINRKKIYLDIYVNGQRRRESLRLTVPDDPAQKKEVMRLANIAKSKREQQIFSGEWALLDHIGGRKPLYGYLEGMAKGRLKNDRVNRALKYLKEYPGGQVIQLGQVNEKWVRAFQEYMTHDTDLSPASAASYSQAIRMALNQAVKENIIPQNPAIAVKSIPVPESDKVFLNNEEIQKLADTPVGGKLGAEVKRAFLFACFTGLRVSDLKTLTWGDIEHKPLQIIKRQKKTDRKVFIPLHETAWKIINDGAIHSHAEPVFPRLGAIKDRVNIYLVKWAEKAGLEKRIGWHTARHTFGTLSLESGADIYTVSKLLGHTDLKTTAIYARATDRKKREAVNGLPGIEIEQEGVKND
jgi:integrase